MAKGAKKKSSDARFDIQGIPDDVKVVDFYPDLLKYPEFRNDFDETDLLLTDRVHRYALWMYTDNGLRNEIPVIMDRKKEAALRSGFKINKTGKFYIKVQALIMCDLVYANRLFVRVASLNGSSKFAQLVVYDDARHRQMIRLLEGGDSREKIKEIHNNIRTFSEDIEALEKELLKEDRSRPLISELYEEVTNQQLGIRPEEYAEAIQKQNFNKFLYNPYEKKIVLAEFMEQDYKKPRRKGRPRRDV